MKIKIKLNKPVAALAENAIKRAPILVAPSHRVLSSADDDDVITADAEEEIQNYQMPVLRGNRALSRASAAAKAARIDEIERLLTQRTSSLSSNLTQKSSSSVSHC